ncbi:MAG: ClpP family protease [Planctomycetota bacterium]
MPDPHPDRGRLEGGCDDDKGGGEKLLDRLMKTRTILISEPVTSELSQKILPRLLLLEAEDPEAPVKVLINSPGGAVDDGFAIYDMMRFIKCPVTSICIGLAASAATIILLGGDPGRRFALPNTRLLLHQPSQAMRGVASDIEISANEILRIRERINVLLAKETGQDSDRILKDLNRDYWLSADQAVEYGLISKVIERADEV